jgi:sugar phosphate isomerase/epimerase
MVESLRLTLTEYRSVSPETTMRTKPFLLEQSTRREFIGRAAAIAACAAISPHIVAAETAPKPNSVIHGVRVGVITYSYRGGNINTAEETLKALLEDGLSDVELMDGPIQSFAGIRVLPGRGNLPAGRPGGSGESKPTDADREAQLAKCRDLRKMYNDAGVNIHLHKLPFGQSDEEIDFNFEVAKALGCVGITTERSDEMAKKLAPFADRHKIWVAFHNHTNNFPKVETEDPLVSYGQYVGFNLDVGHYFAGTKGLSPLPVLEKYHDRIVSLHMKDRTADGKNLPWGQGQTPLKEILQLMRKEKWTFPADIEVEYQIPAGSSSVAEVAKCVQFCREALA